MEKTVQHFKTMSREQILATRPGTWGDYELLSVIRHFDQEQRDQDRAMAIAELILRSPGHSEAVDYGELYFEVIEHYKWKRDFSAALRWAYATIAYGEQHWPGMNRFNHWRDLAEVYLRAGDFDTGLAMFTRVLRADPSDIWTYNILGFELSDAGLHQLAIEALDKGLYIVAQHDPERLQEQLANQRRQAAEKLSAGGDRTDEVRAEVLTEFRTALSLSPGKPRHEDEPMPYLPPMDRLLALGVERDDAVYEKIMDQGLVLIPELIRMAFDNDLHIRPADDPAHHAPAHAVALLRSLRERADLDELSLWLSRADGDWYTLLLSEHCGKIGGYTTDELEALAADMSYNVYVRESAVNALIERVTRQPALRGRVVEFLHMLLNRPEAKEASEEVFIGFLIGDILDLDARELYPAIRRAFDEDRVDTSIIGLDDVHEQWGMERLPRPKRRKDGMYLRLRCKVCNRDREHFVQHVLVDVLTLERIEKGKPVSHDPYIMDREIVCPKCGAVDRYEMTPQGHMALLGPKGISAAVRSLFGGEKPSVDIRGNPRVHYFKSYAFGRPMHPLAALDEYRRRIAAHPKDAKLHLRMGNLLRTLGRHTDALAEHRQAHALDADNAEIALTLAMTAHDCGDSKTAQAMYEHVLELASRKKWFRGKLDNLAHVAREGLTLLKHKKSSPWASPFEDKGAVKMTDHDQARPAPVSKSPARSSSKRSKKRSRKRKKRSKRRKR